MSTQKLLLGRIFCCKVVSNISVFIRLILEVVEYINPDGRRISISEAAGSRTGRVVLSKTEST